MTKKIAIIGAGLAGSVLAERLSFSADVTLFEKSRGTGGRLASCRLGDDSADLGAPWFSPSTEKFRIWLEQQPEITRWQPQICDFNHVNTASDCLYLAGPKQSALTRRLSRHAQLITQCRVASVLPLQTEQTPRTLLHDDQSIELGCFDSVIITTPAQQAKALLEAIPEFSNNTESISTDPCWVCVIKIKGQLDSADVFYGDHPVLFRCTKDSAKPGRQSEENCETWVLEATKHWSKNHIDANATDIFDALHAAFCELIHKTPDILSSRTHRWLLARHRMVCPTPFLWHSETGIGACGDWFNSVGLTNENGIETSWLSVNALADTILQESL